MVRLVFAYGGAFLAMLSLDAIWLSTMAERLYRPQLGDLLADEFRAAPAVRLLCALSLRDRLFRRRASPAGGRLAQGGAQRRTARARRLRNLRSHQSGDATSIGRFW